MESKNHGMAEGEEPKMNDLEKRYYDEHLERVENQMEKNHKSFEDKVDKIFVLINGNGKIGIVGRLVKLETIIDNTMSTIKWLFPIGVVMGVFGIAYKIFTK